MKTNIPNIRKLLLFICLYILFSDANNMYFDYLRYEKNAENCVDEDGNEINLQISSIHSCYRTEIDRTVPRPFVERITDEISNVEKFAGLSSGAAVDIIQIRRNYKKEDTDGYEIFIGTHSLLFPMEKTRIVICPSNFSFKSFKDSLCESTKGLVDHEVFHAIDDHFGSLSNNPLWVKQFQRMSNKNNYDKNSIFMFIDMVLDEDVETLQSNKNEAEFFAFFTGTLYSNIWEKKMSKSWYSYKGKEDYKTTLYALSKIINSKKELKNTEFSHLIKKRIKFLNKINNQKYYIKKSPTK